jgi:adenosine deaminase
MAVTAAVVTKNVFMSRRWKAELVAHGILIQPSPRVMYFLPLKPDHSSVCPVCPESLQHLVVTLKIP